MSTSVPVRYDELAGRVQFNCRGAELDVILPALRWATRLFCQRTEVWQVELDPINLVAEQVDYTIGTDNWTASIVRIVEVRLRSDEEVASGATGAIVAGQFYTFTPPSTLTLNDQIEPHAAVTDGLVVKVILLPSLEAVELDSWLFNRYGEALIAKAVHDLKGQQDKPWSDPKGRDEWRYEYLRGIANARGDLARGFSIGEGLQA